jgi:hypothetical protein
MKFFDVGQEANGFIAIGQMATGFIAIGQLATGFIAIGQLARGFFAVGMLTYGVVSIGMLGVGIGAMTGMLGLGGTRMAGLVLPLVPWPAPKPKYPQTTPLGSIRQQNANGWVPVQIETDHDGNVMLRHEGLKLAAEIETGLRGAARAVGVSGGVPALALLVANGDGTYLCRKLMHMAPRQGLGINLALAPFQIALLIVLAIGFWPLVAMPIVEALFVTP